MFLIISLRLCLPLPTPVQATSDSIRYSNTAVVSCTPYAHCKRVLCSTRSTANGCCIFCFLFSNSSNSKEHTRRKTQLRRLDDKKNPVADLTTRGSGYPVADVKVPVWVVCVGTYDTRVGGACRSRCATRSIKGCFFFEEGVFFRRLGCFFFMRVFFVKRFFEENVFFDEGVFSDYEGFFVLTKLATRCLDSPFSHRTTSRCAEVLHERSSPRGVNVRVPSEVHRVFRSSALPCEPEKAQKKTQYKTERKRRENKGTCRILPNLHTRTYLHVSCGVTPAFRQLDIASDAAFPSLGGPADVAPLPGMWGAPNIHAAVAWGAAPSAVFDGQLDDQSGLEPQRAQVMVRRFWKSVIWSTFALLSHSASRDFSSQGSHQADVGHHVSAKKCRAELETRVHHD